MLDNFHSTFADDTLVLLVEQSRPLGLAQTSTPRFAGLVKLNRLLDYLKNKTAGPEPEPEPEPEPGLFSVICIIVVPFALFGIIVCIALRACRWQRVEGNGGLLAQQ